MECNSPEATRREAYVALCRHSLYVMARLGDEPPQQEAAQGDLRRICASASPRAISKRCSDDLDHVAHTSPKKARLSSIFTPPVEIDAIQTKSESYQALNAGSGAQVVVQGSIAVLARNGQRGEDGIQALVIGMLSFKFLRFLFEKI